MFCSICGAEVPKGAGYCGKCGSPTVETLGLVDPAPVPPPVPPPLPVPPAPAPVPVPEPVPPAPKPIPTPGPVPPAPIPKSKAVWWILLLVVLAGGGWWAYSSQKSGTILLPNMVKQEHSVVIGNVPFTVRGRLYSYWKFEVPVGATEAFVDGTFSAAGGADDMIFAYVLDEDAFATFKNEQPASTVYNSGKVTQGSIHVPISPGTYYLVFDNKFSRDASKAVQVAVTLHYK